jgi:hypothetical protein
MARGTRPGEESDYVSDASGQDRHLPVRLTGELAAGLDALARD